MKPEDAARALGPPGRLSRIEKEAMLARIEAARAGWYRRNVARIAAGAGVAAAIATAVIVLAPERRDAELTARGEAGFTLVIRCGDRDPGDCRIGDRLAFDFGSAPPAGYVALFARSATGIVIWYMPADEATPSVELAAHARAGVLDRVGIIDGSYAPGRYELHAIVSARPLSRADIRGFARGDRLVPPSDVRVETRTFVIRGEETSR